MRKLAVIAAFAASSIAALADATYTNVVMSVDGPAEAIRAVQTGMQGIFDKLGPAVLAVVVAGVAIWAIPRIVGVLKSAFGQGKGR